MKKLLKKIARRVRKIGGKIVVVSAVAVSALSPQPSAFAQVTPSTPILLTNIPNGFVGASGTNLFTGCTNALGTPSNNVIQLWQGNGLAFVQKFLTTNASAQIGTATTNSVTMQWALSFDGTNFLTNPESLLNISNYGVSSNIACGGTNITSAFLNNFAYVAPYTISNNMTGATNDITNYQAWAVHGAPFNGGFP